MFSTYTTVVLVCYLPLISPTLISIYKNARFNPLDNHSMIFNFSSIEAQNICICRCLMNSMCKTVTYNGYYQYCVLYLAYLQEGQLQMTTINTSSSVISLRNMTLSDSTISSLVIKDPAGARPPTQVTSQASITTMGTIVTTAMTTTPVATCTTLITFDDISSQSSTSTIIPNGYKNLNWTYAEYINVSTILTNSGYSKGVRTEPFVMHNPTGDNITITTANGTRFSFDSLFLTSAWRDSLSVTMGTIRAGTLTSAGVYTIMTSHPTYIYCNFCTDIDTITLQSGGGIPHANFTQNGTQLIIDNLCISFGH